MHLQNYFHSIIVWPFALLEVAFHVSQGHYFVGKMACTQTLVDGSPRIQKNPLTHQRAQTPTISTTQNQHGIYGLEKVGLSRFSFEPINFVQSENTKTQPAALTQWDIYAIQHEMKYDIIALKQQLLDIILCFVMHFKWPWFLRFFDH